jgi:Resolvase, N terminal domain
LYVRVSTSNRSTGNQAVFEQNPDVQELPLRQLAEQRGWTVVKVYSDRMSGSKADRPGLKALMQDARRGAFDVVLVWRFDRFARSIEQLVLALAEFRSLGIDFVSCQEALDTSTPMGKAMFTIVGAMAELERNVIRERTSPDWNTPGVAGPRAVSESAGRLRYSTACAWRSCGTRGRHGERLLRPWAWAARRCTGYSRRAFRNLSQASAHSVMLGKELPLPSSAFRYQVALERGGRLILPSREPAAWQSNLPLLGRLPPRTWRVPGANRGLVRFERHTPRSPE